MNTKYSVSEELKIKPSSNPDYYEIFNDQTKRKYRITSSMYNVLSLFKEGSCKEEVIKKIAQEANADYDTISNMVSPLIHFLIKSRSIVNKSSFAQNKNVFNDGDKFRNYTVEDIIACNNKGEVYKCYNIETKGYLILKIINNQKIGRTAKDQELVSAINTEFEITLKASNISDWVIKPVEQINDNIHGLVLEFFEGSTVPKFLNKEKQDITKEAIEKLIFQILAGFELIHNNNILHGDIHLNNILINDQLEIKIIDFGLARDLAAKKSISNFGGVSFFCPPERIGLSFQHKFKSEGNFASEVYQIALIIYFMCFGVLPFKGYTWQELRNSILTDAPLFVDCDNYKKLDWSDELKEFLSIALNKSPEKRFQSVTAMKKYLSDITM